MRGNILREEYYDLKRRIDATDVMSRLACFNHMKSTFAPVSDGYALASSVDRERILKEIREVSRHLWNAGDRPQALAFGVIMLAARAKLARPLRRPCTTVRDADPKIPQATTAACHRQDRDGDYRYRPMASFIRASVAAFTKAASSPGVN